MNLVFIRLIVKGTWGSLKNIQSLNFLVLFNLVCFFMGLLRFW